MARDDHARRLLLLFHGVAASAADLESLGRLLARRSAPAFVVSVCAPFAYDRGPGRQWFSVQGISEGRRRVRAAAAMPLFISAVRHWQDEAALGAAATTLLGFSQGAIMALESLHCQQPLAARVVAIAGRFASLPRLAPPLKVNLLHGEGDRVISSAQSQRAFKALTALGCDVSLDLIPHLGHEIDARVIERILDRLTD